MQAVQEVQDRVTARLLSAEEVGRTLGIDVSTVYRMAADGRLTAVKVGRQWRFPPESIGSIPLPVVLDARVATAAINVAASLLGVMMAVTDLDGSPVTPVVNPCGRFLEASESAAQECLAEWRTAARDSDLGPRFRPSLLGFECASAFIRSGDRLVGLVVAGGIAPEGYPGDDMYTLTNEGRQELLAALPRIAAAVVEGRTS